MLKGLGNIAALMRQAPLVIGKMQDVQDELRQRRATATAGGGLVEVETNGLGEVQRVKLDPVLLEGRDREMIEDLLVAAFNQAQTKANELRADAMQSMAEGLDMPSLSEALSQFTNEGNKS